VPHLAHRSGPDQYGKLLICWKDQSCREADRQKERERKREERDGLFGDGLISNFVGMKMFGGGRKRSALVPGDFHACTRVIDANQLTTERIHAQTENFCPYR
jgi:hypothetical protein